MIVAASKKEYGTYSLKSAFVGQEKIEIWKMLVIALVFFGITGLLSVFVALIENQIFAAVRSNVLSNLPIGFDWTDYEYMNLFFSKPILILTCVYYCIFNVLIGPITEELFFRGYLTSHYKKQSSIVAGFSKNT